MHSSLPCSMYFKCLWYVGCRVYTFSCMALYRGWSITKQVGSKKIYFMKAGSLIVLNLPSACSLSSRKEEVSLWKHQWGTAKWRSSFQKKIQYREVHCWQPLQWGHRGRFWGCIHTRIPVRILSVWGKYEQCRIARLPHWNRWHPKLELLAEPRWHHRATNFDHRIRTVEQKWLEDITRDMDEKRAPEFFEEYCLISATYCIHCPQFRQFHHTWIALVHAWFDPPIFPSFQRAWHRIPWPWITRLFCYWSQKTK